MQQWCPMAMVVFIGSRGGVLGGACQVLLLDDRWPLKSGDEFWKKKSGREKKVKTCNKHLSVCSIKKDCSAIKPMICGDKNICLRRHVLRCYAGERVFQPLHCNFLWAAIYGWLSPETIYSCRTLPKKSYTQLYIMQRECSFIQVWGCFWWVET